jgi:localization factor PodJL
LFTLFCERWCGDSIFAACKPKFNLVSGGGLKVITSNTGIGGAKMSRIRSQLDAIMSDNNVANRVPNGRQPAPRRAQPAFPPQSSPRDMHARPQQENTQADPAHYANSHTGYNPVSANSNQLDSIQQRLDQLTGKLGTMTRPAATPQPVGKGMQPLQQAMMQEIREGFSQVRQELASARQNRSEELGDDLQRISQGIALLQDSRNLHPDYIEQMQSELNNLQQGLEQLLSRQETQIDLSGVSRSIEGGYSDIVSKLDQLLTGRVSETSEINIPDYSEKLNFMNARIEEMSRVLVSMAVSPDGQNEQNNFERIEARLASLAKSVEDLQFGNSQPVAEQQIVDLSPINARLDTLQNDIGILAAGLEQQHMSDGGSNDNAMPGLAEAMENSFASFAGIEQRLGDLADRLDGLCAAPGENPNASGQEILSILRELVEKVENIENRPAAAAGTIDLTSLEAQLAEIVQHFDGPGGQNVNMAPITERLDNIEGQIASSRDIVIDMATQAAEKSAPADNGDNAAMMASILDELRELRDLKNSLAPQSPEENRQLADISTNMTALLDRIDQLEQGVMNTLEGARHVASGSVLETLAHEYAGQDTNQQTRHHFHEDPNFTNLHNQPNGMDQHFDPVVEADGAIATDPQALHEAPSLDEYQNTASANGEPSGIGRDEDILVEPDTDDVPLAPGSGMPDLEALVRRATQRKKERPTEQSGNGIQEDGNISELMAAARRAAQAASVEAQSEKAKPSRKKSKMPNVPSFGKPAFLSKKVLLMSVAVAAVAIGGLTLAPKITGFLGGNKTEARTSSMLTPSVPAVEENASKVETPVTDNTGDSIAEATTKPAVEQSALLSAKPVAEISGEPKADPATTPVVENAAEPVKTDSQPVAAAADIPSDVGNQALIDAASAGNGEALFEIARRYTDGDGVERSLEKAVAWYEKSAETGFAPAQYRLGNFYEKGHGVSADPAKAAQWYEKAAAKGNALAMHNLAVLNVTGQIGKDVDMPTAIGWFEKAADLGVKDSQVNLGILYTKGMGVTENLEEAYKWFAVAAKGGDADAGKKRDTVAQVMRPEQLEKARGAAELWKPAALDPKTNIATVLDEWKSLPSLQSTGLSQQEIIRQTQQLLTRAGFDAGPSDGKMGDRTREAIVSFQKKAGLPADGQISPALVEALSKQSI